MKKYSFLLLFILCIIFIPISINYVSAVGVAGDGGVVTLKNPLGEQNMSVQTLIGKIINGVLGIVGSLALLMFIYGGFTWMTAAGASDKVTKGKDILVWSTIGLVVIFSSYAIVRFLFTDILTQSMTAGT